MNVEFVNSVLEAVVNVLKTMAFTEPRAGEPFLKEKETSLKGDVTGAVGLTGPVNGSLAVSFSTKAILHIVSNMLGEACKEINGDVEDAVGELTNMICGDARRLLADKGFQFEGAIPTVITGKQHKIAHAVSGPSIVIPFSLGEHGDFFSEICFE